jgi:hypothetical protein
MFTLNDDYVEEFIYDADFNNPVTISIYNKPITLIGRCTIFIEHLRKFMGYEKTGETFTGFKIVFGIETNEIILETYKSENQHHSISFKEQIVMLRKNVNKVNCAIEKSYEKDGIMYNKSQEKINNL